MEIEGQRYWACDSVNISMTCAATTSQPCQIRASRLQYSRLDRRSKAKATRIYQAACFCHQGRSKKRNPQICGKTAKGASPVTFDIAATTSYFSISGELTSLSLSSWVYNVLATSPSDAEISVRLLTKLSYYRTNNSVRIALCTAAFRSITDESSSSRLGFQRDTNHLDIKSQESDTRYILVIVSAYISSEVAGCSDILNSVDA